MNLGINLSCCFKGVNSPRVTPKRTEDSFYTMNRKKTTRSSMFVSRLVDDNNDAYRAELFHVGVFQVYECVGKDGEMYIKIPKDISLEEYDNRQFLMDHFKKFGVKVFKTRYAEYVELYECIKNEQGEINKSKHNPYKKLQVF